MNFTQEHQAFLARRTREFETFCRRLRRNGIVRNNCVDIESDVRAFQLAEALQKNQSLQVLKLQMWPTEMTHRGARALGKAVRSSAVTRLSILNEQYGDEGTECMWCFYSNALANIQELNIPYDLNDMDAMELGALLRGHRSLRKVTLGLDQRTEEGALELSKGIQNSNISHLELNNASPVICQTLLSSGVMRLRSLRHVLINDDQWQEYAAPVLQDWSAFGGISKQNAAACLRRASTLETIKLNQCYLSNDEAKLLAAAIRGNCNLKVLGLYGNHIADDGAAELAVSCRGCSQLEMLDLRLNQIGVDGFCHLLSELALHSSLKLLDLSFNPNMGREGLSSIPEEVNGTATPLYLPPNLRLRSCELTGKDMVALFSNRFCSTDLKSLQLESNHIDDDGVESLVAILNSGLALVELGISYNRFGDLGLRKLVVMTTTHPTLKELDVCGCKGFTYQHLALLAKDLTTSKLLSFQIGVDDTDRVVAANSECSSAQGEARKAAAQALLKAVKGNMHLQKLNLFLMDIPKKLQSDMQFFLDLNKSGRQLLRLDHGLHPFGLWSHVLAKSGNNASVLYYLLEEQPWLIPAFLIKAKQPAPVPGVPIVSTLPKALAESFLPRPGRVTKKRPMVLADESFFARSTKKNHIA